VEEEYRNKKMEGKYIARNVYRREWDRIAIGVQDGGFRSMNYLNRKGRNDVIID
jgi:hypothetical protein